MKKKEKILLIVSGAATAVICLVMNLVLIPSIEKTTEGIRCFDMNFGYSFDDAKRFLALLSPEGLNTYLHVQLPLDFVYPIAYCLFFCLAIYALIKKRTALLAAPILLAALDYTENICSIIMLKGINTSESFIRFASAVTSAKTVLMYLVFAVIIVLFVVRIVKSKKNTAATK